MDRNRKGRYEYLWNHGVLSDEVWADITSHCNFNSSDGAACVSTLDGHDLGLADPYNIYSSCYVREKKILLLYMYILCQI